MFVRRILILLAAFCLVMVALVVRLARWQIAEGAVWKPQADAYTDRHFVIATSRGTIYDRNDMPLAADDPCTELQIDYRALNLEYRWLKNVAILRLKKNAGVTSRLERAKKLPDEMQAIADQLNLAPKKIAAMLGTPNAEAEILDRYNDIRERVSLLKLNREMRYFSKKEDEGNPTPDIDPDSALAEERSFHTIWRLDPGEQERKLRMVFEDIDADKDDRWLREFPGIVVGNATRRKNPYGEVAAHLIGTMRPLRREDIVSRENPGGVAKLDIPDLRTPGDVGNLEGYLPVDEIGASGIEAAMETKLHGARGVKLVELGADEGTYSKIVNPRAGQDVRLTIDIELQKAFHAALLDKSRRLREGTKDGQKDGIEHPVASVILRIADGEIIAMVSLPTYDLSQWDERKSEWLKDAENAPLLNRAAQSATPPGSTIKPLIAAAALSERVVTPADRVMCNGSLHGIACLGLHGYESMQDALRQSCNVYFMTMGDRLGLAREAKWFDAYGFGRKTGIEIGERPGTYTDPAAAGIGAKETALQGMGQGRLSTTPLQMANAYATLLRGGMWIQPHLVMGTPIVQKQTVRIEPAVLDVVKEGMRAVVTNGTAKKTIHLKLPTAGKTGTAESFRPVFNEDGTPKWKIGVRDAIDPETGAKIRGDNGQIVREEGPLVPVYKSRNGRIVRDARGRATAWYVGQQESVKGDDAWFIGYAPADKPQYVIATIMEFGGHGGDAAAPIFEEAVKLLQAHGYLTPLDVPRIVPQQRKSPRDPNAPLGTEENPVGKIPAESTPIAAGEAAR